MTQIVPIPRQALADLVGQLAGVQCVWAADASPALGQTGGVRAWIKLAVTAYGAKGEDELRTMANPKNANVLKTEITGYRLFTVQMRAESMDAGAQPYELLELVRSGLVSVTAEAVLRQAQVGLVRIHTISGFAGASGTRAKLMASMDVELGKLGGIASPGDDDGATIRSVNGGAGIPFLEP